MNNLHIRQILPIAITISSLLFAPDFSYAKKTTTPPTADTKIQEQLNKANRYVKSSKPEKAIPYITSALSAAQFPSQCIRIAESTESCGFPLLATRRQCLQRALELCTTKDDYFQVATKSRHYEFYEITHACINHLVQGANSKADLMDVAHKAQALALNDVAHLAMEKVYAGEKSKEEAIQFAHDAKALGMDDLVRKAIKDLINDEDNAHNLCILLKEFEDLEMVDLNRYCLKKSLDKATTVDDLQCIYDAANRNKQVDIAKVALFRGRKLVLIQKIQKDQAEYQRELELWKQGVDQDLAKQQAEAEKNMGLGTTTPKSKRFDNEPPTSGF